ncbi:response regulator transcription factor [Ferruginibacter sp. HRS2-29]|uniref:response regulator transcription factor n=1 Tax=Ferruginibacter sp. HRS2-29 TaxID=2487334 RepID=UPI0020CE6B46|nr:response regulator transcription factor [Ferruginibacter sp. HRS2-29]MCP9752346.1 DNA-binding response regulator [Ferruginibacter sp. HRS2-29]
MTNPSLTCTGGGHSIAGMETTGIAIVDDQQLFREGLAALIGTVPGFRLLQNAETGRQLLEQLAAGPALPDILLMDMKLPDTNGMELNALLQKTYPAIRVIVVSMYEQERLVYRMIEAGACGYLAKNCDKQELIAAINTTMRSGFYFNFNTMQAMRKAATYKNQTLRTVNNIPFELTEREEEVLQLICKEFTNAEIAAQLFISVRTVDGHRNNLLMKTGCKNTAGLVVFAIRYGLFEVDI